MSDYIKRLAGPYTGAGQTTFTFGFFTYQAKDIYVGTAMSNDEAATILEQDVDYTVTLNDDQEAFPGGSITLLTPGGLKEGETLVIGSCLEYVKNIDLTNHSRFPPEQIDTEFNRIVIMIQQIVEETGRALSIPPTSNETQEQMIKRLFIARDVAEKAADEARKSSDVAKGVEEKVKEYSWDVPHLVNSVEDVERYPHDGYFWVKGFGNPGQAGSDISNRLVNVAGGQRTLGSKLSDIVSVKDFGAKGDGVTDDTAAFRKAMSLGWLFVPAGSYLLSSVSIEADMYFCLGAHIKAKPGATVELKGQITSPKQFIFRGDGNYVIAGKDGDTGEHYKETHCSWWGVFPGSYFADVNSARLKKLFSAYGNEREGVVYFDIGGYHLSETVDVPRGCAVKGDGTRKTVFVPHSDGWPVFRTVGDGAQFNDIQFETATSGQPWQIRLRQSPAIQDDFGHCVIEDVIFTNHANAIAIYGNLSAVHRVSFSIDTQDGDENSAYITVKGNYFECDGVFCNYGQSYSSGSIFLISPDETTGIMRGITIRNVHTISHSRVVKVDATRNSILGLTIDGVNYHAIAGNNPDDVVRFNIANTKYVQSVLMANWVVNGYPTNIVSIDVSGNGRFLQSVASNITAFGSSATGSGFVISVPEGEGTEKVNLIIGPTSINRKALVTAPEDARVTVKSVSYS